MSDDLVKRLRDWEHVWPQDLDEPEGGLYLKAADRIEELEAKLAKAEVLQEAQKLFNYYAVEIVTYGATVARLQNLENAWLNLKTQAELTGGKDE